MLAALVFSTATSLCGFPAQWDSSRGPSEVMTLLVDPVFRFSLPLRSWMRSLSTGSKFISYLTLTLMRTRSSRNRPESWRWERDTLLMSAVKMSTRPFACLGTANPVSPWFNLRVPWPASFFSRPVFPLLWLAPTSWSRWRERRSVVVSTPGEWLKWRTQSTMTSSSYAPCLCECRWW